jgi:hypothetical protein
MVIQRQRQKPTENWTWFLKPYCPKTARYKYRVFLCTPVKGKLPEIEVLKTVRGYYGRVKGYGQQW